jgi:hypothetical protein
MVIFASIEKIPQKFVVLRPKRTEQMMQRGLACIFLVNPKTASGSSISTGFGVENAVKRIFPHMPTTVVRRP